jgi:crossover junction endodeoxyribonuclease RuvC
MIVLGIDPGLAATGYGVVERRGSRLVALDGGVVETAAGVRVEERLGALHDALSGLLREHEPVAMALESLYFGANARTAFAVGQARGVAMLCAGQRGVACFSYTPQQVKGAVCGTGSAPKDQVARMVAALLALASPPSSDHASDALAVAICHANRAPLAHAIGALAG